MIFLDITRYNRAKFIGEQKLRALDYLKARYTFLTKKENQNGKTKI